MPSKRGRKRAAVLAIVNRILTKVGNSPASLEAKARTMAMQKTAITSGPTNQLGIFSSQQNGGSTLATLPVDIILIIFKSFDDHDSPRSLAQCSRFLRQVYHANERAISIQYLPYHPFLNGKTISFYQSAIDIYRLQQKQAGIGKQSSISGLFQLKTDMLDPEQPAVDGLELVTAVLRNASIVNKTATDIFSNLNSNEPINFLVTGGFRIEPQPSSEVYAKFCEPQHVRPGWMRCARDVIREILYRAWITLLSNQRLQRKIGDYVGCPMAPDQMGYFAEQRWQVWGYPDLTPILPLVRSPRISSWVVMMDVAFKCREYDGLKTFTRGEWKTEKRDEDTTDSNVRRAYTFRSSFGHGHTFIWNE